MLFDIQQKFYPPEEPAVPPTAGRVIIAYHQQHASHPSQLPP